MNAESFHTPEVARITGVPFRTVDYWARQGILVPSIAVANGTGTERLYSWRDMLAVKAIACVPSNSAATRKLIGLKVYRWDVRDEFLDIVMSDFLTLKLHMRKILAEIRMHADQGGARGER